MLFKSHLVVGICAWTVAAPTLAISYDNFLCWAAVVLGSILPDIDHPKSVIGQAFGILSQLVSKMVGHRGITHSGLAIALCITSITHFDNEAYLMALTIGYTSHLAGDFVTKSGIPILWPLKRRFRFLITFQAGGAIESLVVLGVVFISGIHLLH